MYIAFLTLVAGDMIFSKCLLNYSSWFKTDGVPQYSCAMNNLYYMPLDSNYDEYRTMTI